MSKLVSQEAHGYLLIVPTGGLNDGLNQVYHGLSVAQSKHLIPVVTLSPGTHYESNLDDLINCKTNIWNLSSLAQLNRWPTNFELRSMLAVSLKNTPLPTSGNDFVYFGSGGGIRGSTRLLSKYGLSEPLREELERAISFSDLETPAIHIRCSDMSPNKRVIAAISKHKKSATIYSDCDYREFLSGDHYLEGYSPSGQNLRSGSNLVSLVLLSKHKSLFPTPVQNNDENNEIKFSGFGLLALVVHLKEHGLMSIIGNYTIRTLWNILRMDPKMLAAVIWEALRPVRSATWKTN